MREPKFDVGDVVRIANDEVPQRLFSKIAGQAAFLPDQRIAIRAIPQTVAAMAAQDILENFSFRIKKQYSEKNVIQVPSVIG